MATTKNTARRAGIAAVALLAALLGGCAGTVKHDARVTGDLSRLEGVTQVVATLSPEATRLQLETPQFNRDELASRLRARLESKGLTAPAATHRVEIAVTDMRVRGAFTAIMFGFMAGDDHVTGKVRVLDPAGRALRSFEIHASYAFGGVAGGQDSVRMNWLYDKFADLAAAELEKVIVPPRAGAGPIPAIAATGTAPAMPASAQPVPATNPPVAAIDNVDAVPISERGRAAYREWLARPKPRAFVVSDNGFFYPTYGTKPTDPNEAADPTERAMKRCQTASRPNCTVYAVDDRVLYTRPAAVTAVR